MIQECPIGVGRKKLSGSKSFSGNILIIDTLGKLQLAKWRLMSDQLPVRYLTRVPSREELMLEAPGLILLQLSAFTELMETMNQDTHLMSGISYVVVGRKEEEQGLKQAFAKGAKAILTLPLDLPKVSAVCRRELELATTSSEQRVLRPQIVSVNKNKNELEKVDDGITPDLEGLILNTLRLGILFIGLDGKIILANNSLKKLMNLSEDKIRGKTCIELLPAGSNRHHDMICRLVTEALEHHKTYQDMEVLLPGPEGNNLPALVNIKLVGDKHDKKSGVLVTVNAHSVIKEKRDIRARSEKLAAAGQLAAGAVHEIKNPLTSVRGFIQLLQNELAGNPKAEYIDIIISEIDRVNNIVNEFLKLAKPAEPKTMSCSLAELFEEIRILMESEAFLKNVVIEERFSQLPPVKVDKEQIKQVLINVIQNAFDAMPKGGRLTIKAVPLDLDKKIKIELIDTGFGMPEEIYKRIFDPFFTTKDHGTGLGLSVSQQILESHGGGIEIVSEPGKGTVTMLYLPY